MTENTQIFQTPVEANNRLSNLGLNLGQIISVVDAMTAARANCTENHPSSAPGLMSWIEGTCRLRDVTLPAGWEREDKNQVPTVVNKSKKIRLAVMNTDSGTGLADCIPQPTSKKGAATERAANDNQQELFGSAEVATYRGDVANNGVLQWYVMVFANRETVRAEVSCPTSLTDGAFSAFRERIIIDVDSDGSGHETINRTTPTPDIDSEAEFEIPVQRKQA